MAEKNKGVTTPSNTEVVTPRTTKVTVGIKRSLNTAQYENLEVLMHLEDDITWSTAEERTRKVGKLVESLDAQFVITQKQVLSDLGIAEKRAWFKQPTTNMRTTPGDNNLGDELLR